MSKYYIKQACEILNTSDYNLRYLEKVLDLEIKRDDMENRFYTEKDITLLRDIIHLKDQGLNYKAIKTVLNAKQKFSDQNNSPDKTQEQNEKNTLIKKNLDTEMKKLDIKIKSIIENTLEDILTPKFSNIENKIDNINNAVTELKKENTTLKSELESNQKEYFNELDKKLEKHKRKTRSKEKKSWIKKIFSSHNPKT